MPISDAAATASGMLSDLKSRLGFARNDEQYDDYEEEYDEYDEYGDDLDDYEDDYDDYDNGYSSRPARGEVGGFRPATTSSGRFGRADSAAGNLVTLEDVRANTTYTEGASRVTAAAAEAPSMRRTIGGRNLVENTGPAQSSPAYNAAMRERERQQVQDAPREATPRTGGVDSLFQPSTGAGAGAAYDPYVAYSNSSPASYSSARGLTVLRPVAYGDVERIARAVKAGDMVVLAMRNTPEDLQKRVLDFSFGVASALDASVECPAEKVFAIARGRELSEEEKRSLRTQGVL